MITVSQDYRNQLNGNSLTPKSKIVVDGNEYLGNVIKTCPKISHSSTSFIGGFPSKTVNFEIFDINSNLDFENKEITVYKGLIVGNSIEWVKQGIFIPKAKDITTNKNTKTISFKNVQDRTQLLENKYTSNLDWSTKHTGLEIVQEICNRNNIVLANTDFAFANYKFNQPNFNETITDRQVISSISEIGGEIAFFNNNGYLTIKSQYITGDTISRKRYEKLSYEKPYTINTVVLGNEDMDNDIVYPEIIETSRVSFKINDNPFVDLHKQEMIGDVATYIIGKTYIPFDLNNFVDGNIYELNDVLEIEDRNGNVFNAVILDISNTSRIKSNVKAVDYTEKATKYNLAGSNKKSINEVKIEVDHINQTINEMAVSITDTESKTSQLQLQSDEITQRLENEQYYIDEDGNKQSIIQTINELKNTAEELNLNLQKIGGLNLMKNSSGQNGTIGYKSKMLKPYVEFQTWAEFDNYISLGSKVYQIYTCFIHVVGETTDSERDCWYGLYYTEGFSKSYYFEQVVRNGNFIYPDKYNKYMDILYDNLFMFVEQNYTNSSSFKTFLEKYTDEYTNITPNIFTSISNDIIENNTISKSAFLLTPTVRDMYTTMNEDRIYGESFTMPKNTNKLYFSVKSKIDGLCGRARLIMYQLNDKMENIQNNLNVYDSYENHIVNANFINIPDNILNNDNFIEYKVEMEISDRCVEILPCFSIGNNFVNDGPYVNFVNPILNPITRFYWKKVWETIDEVSAYYTYRSTHIKKKLQFFESATLPEISDTPDFTQLWLCTDEIEGYTKDTLYTPQYEIDSNGEIISRTWAQTDYTKEQIERGIEITMFDNWTYVYSAGAVESATPRPDMKFIIADCMVSATDTSWQPASGENYWGKNIKISGDKGIYIYNTVDGYNRIIDEKQDIAKDKNGNTTWELTGKGMKTKRAECESIRLPKLEILCTNDSTAFYCKENEDDDYGA